MSNLSKITVPTHRETAIETCDAKQTNRQSTNKNVNQTRTLIRPADHPADSAKASKVPYLIALLLSAVAFAVMWVGGLVTTTDAGMAVPDWPNTFGYNMFSYPLESWLYGPFDLMAEHGHRLMASLAGLISIVLVYFTFRFETRPWVRTFSVVLLGLVILQGLLGGARVVMDARVVAKIHGCVAPLFLCGVFAFATVTSKWWRAFDLQQQTDQVVGRATKSMTLFAPVMLAVAYGQLVVGAFMRHINIDAPPNQYKMLVVMHIMTAVVIVLGTLFQWFLSRRAETLGSGTRNSINVLSILVLIQVGLGLTTWVVKYGWPAALANLEFAANFVVGEKTLTQTNLVTAHVAVGSLILACWTIHALRCRRSHYAAARLTLATDP